MQDTIKLTQAISDYGAMVVICAAFISVALYTIHNMIGGMKKFNAKMIDNWEKALTSLSQTTAHQNEMLIEISETMRGESLLRIKTLSTMAFELDTHITHDLVTRIIRENNIANREATERKIDRAIKNQYQHRVAQFDNYTYNRRRLSAFCNPKWIEQVAEAVTAEVYATERNESRTRTNLKMAYEAINNEFYQRVTS